MSPFSWDGCHQLVLVDVIDDNNVLLNFIGEHGKQLIPGVRDGIDLRDGYRVG